MKKIEMTLSDDSIRIITEALEYYKCSSIAVTDEEKIQIDRLIECFEKMGRN